MARKRSEKAIDREIDSYYRQHSQGFTINIMDIGKVFKAGHQAANNGRSIEEAIKEAIKTYCTPA